MEGTVSLGIYDASGKLVRTLHREAETDGGDFVVANDGLVTSWDGKDDAGKPLPPGKYSAHGWMVGDLKVKGEAILGNDWIVDDSSPRIRRIRELFALPDGGFGLGATLANGSSTLLSFDASGKPTQSAGGLSQKALLRDGKVFLSENGMEKEMPIVGLAAPIFAAPARDGGVWVIDREPGGVSVKQFAADGTFERHLAIKPGDPEPQQIAASPVADTIYLLSEDATGQRVTALSMTTKSGSDENTSATTGESGTSIWKILWRKEIWNFDSQPAIVKRLKSVAGDFVEAQGGVTVSLVKNPMENDTEGSLKVDLGTGKDGCFLKAADGLPLRMISDTAPVEWSIFAKSANGGDLVVFLMTGAAVEEYRISRPQKMMRFDCGSLEVDK